MSPKAKVFLASLFVVYPLDQLTKWWISEKIHYADRIEVIPNFFDLTHVRNGGGAFSFFADGPIEQRMAFFVGTTVLAVCLLLLFYRKLEDHEVLSATALGVVLGGALGNLTDRLRLGEVVDFLDVHLTANYTWPTFNVADSAIVIGVILLVIEIFVSEEGEPDGDGSNGRVSERRGSVDPDAVESARSANAS